MLGANQGEVECYAKVKGSARALRHMIALIGERVGDAAQKRLVITHCQNAEAASWVRDEARRLYGFQEVIVQKTAGLSSMYADKGGVIIAF